MAIRLCDASERGSRASTVRRSPSFCPASSTGSCSSAPLPARAARRLLPPVAPLRRVAGHLTPAPTGCSPPGEQMLMQVLWKTVDRASIMETNQL